MAYNKVDLAFNMSKETAARFNAITEKLRFTNEEAIEYLLDLHDKVKPERNDIPEKCPLGTHLHTCVRPEIKTKFRQLAQEYGLSFSQMFSVLVDIYDQRPECVAGQAAWGSDVEAAGDEDATGTMDADGALSKLEDALEMIRDAFLSVASGGGEVASLREQLARSRAETQAAKETYQRKLQAIAAQLQELT